MTVEQDYVRQYENSKYFSNITGYCGEISEDELEEFRLSGNDSYTSGDIIGKTGLENPLKTSSTEKRESRRFM